MSSAAPSRVSLAPGYTISSVLKGGWQLAGGHGAVDASQAMSDMDRFVDAGITTFDCADIYEGVEALIGRWLQRRRVRGDLTPVQVHTKYVPDLDRLPTHSRADVVSIIDRSLTRLAVERIDLVQLHWWDYSVDGYVEAARWLDDLRRAGKIRHLGVTNFDRPHLEAIVTAGLPVVSHQVQYSVLDRRPSRAMAEFCARHGIKLLCYGALAGGFLSNRYLRQADPSPPLENRSLVKYRLIIDEYGGWAAYQQLLATLHDVAMRHGTGIGAVALRWVLDQPDVAGVIVGVRHAQHLADTLRACALALTAVDRADIAHAQEASAGPMGEVYGLERITGGRHASVMRYTLNRGAAP